MTPLHASNWIRIHRSMRVGRGAYHQPSSSLHLRQFRTLDIRAQRTSISSRRRIDGRKSQVSMADQNNSCWRAVMDRVPGAQAQPFDRLRRDRHGEVAAGRPGEQVGEARDVVSPLDGDEQLASSPGAVANVAHSAAQLRPVLNRLDDDGLLARARTGGRRNASSRLSMTSLTSRSSSFRRSRMTPSIPRVADTAGPTTTTTRPHPPPPAASALPTSESARVMLVLGGGCE